MAWAADMGKQILSGAADYRSNKAAAAQAGRDAATARENARRTRLETAQAEEAQRREARRALGSAFTAMAQNGGGVDSFLIGDMARESELDAMNISYNGELQATDLMREANQLDADQRNYKRAAKAAVVGTVFGSATTALSGYSDYKAKQSRERVRTEQKTTMRGSRVVNTAKQRKATPAPSIGKTPSSPAVSWSGAKYGK